MTAIPKTLGLWAGASLLVLASAANAQDHSHHAPPAAARTPVPAADPHAGHDMSDMEH